MGFKDYRKFNKKNDENKDEEIIQNNEEVMNEEVNNEETDINNFEVTSIENIEEVELKAEVTTKGVVIANKLNIRKEASKDADVLTIVSKGTGLGVNLTNSTDEFYCVNTMVNGEMTTGYCMKKFITIGE